MKKSGVVQPLFWRPILPVILAALLLLSIWLLLPPAGPARAADFNVGCNVNELIADLTTANGNGEADTLNLDANCEYELTVVNNSANGPNGLPVINSPITINGNGATIRRADSAPDFRLLYVNSSGVVTLTNLTLANGRLIGGTTGAIGDSVSGGGIYNLGRLTLFDTFVISHTIRGGNGGTGADGAAEEDGGSASGGSAYGGGVYNLAGTVTLQSSTISSNTVTGGNGGTGGNSDGGYGGDAWGGGAYGGGLYNNGGSLSLTAAAFISNSVTGGDGGSGGNGGVGGGANGGSAWGGGLYFGNGQITVSGGHWQDNLAQGGNAGSGGYSDDYGEFELTWAGDAYGGGLAGKQSDSTSGFTLDGEALFQQNQAKSENAYGGGVYYGGSGGAAAALTGLQASHNHAGYLGGGVYLVGDSAVSLSQATIATNTAGDAGGLYVSGAGVGPAVSQTTLSGNTAGYCGGGEIYRARLDNLTVLNNTATDASSYTGGGLCLSGGAGYQSTLVNSRVTTNTAPTGGGGLYVNSSASISQTTIASNTVVTGGGVYVKGSSFGSPLQVQVISSTVQANGPAGVYLNTMFGSAVLTVSGGAVTGHISHGLAIYGGVTIVNNCAQISANSGDGIYFNSSSGSLTVYNSQLAGNSGFGLRNAGSGTASACNNWWGDASGPGGVGPGSGDEVSANVQYTPWQSSPCSGGGPCGGGDSTFCYLPIVIKN